VKLQPVNPQAGFVFQRSSIMSCASLMECHILCQLPVITGSLIFQRYQTTYCSTHTNHMIMPGCVWPQLCFYIVICDSMSTSCESLIDKCSTHCDCWTIFSKSSLQYQAAR
jgi:hypothetical protein